MKKIIPLTLILIVILFGLTFNFKKEVKQTRKGFNVYLKSGNTYVKSDTNEFPKKGYVLNTTESNCVNGGVLSQNQTTKEISVSVSSSDKCNLYFDSENVITLNKLHSLNNSIEIKNSTPDFSKYAPVPTSWADDGVTIDNGKWGVYDVEKYVTYADSYSFDTGTAKYTLTNPQTCKFSECYASLIGKYTGSTSQYSDDSVHNATDVGQIYKITNITDINSSTPYIYYNRSSYHVATFDETDVGLYSMDDNFGESYYFRGNVENNYVKFAKDKNNNDMFWRIIRINGDGTLRLLYDGTSAHDNGESSTDRRVGTSAYNSAIDSNTGSPFDAGYVGYMYGNFTPPTGCTSNNSYYTCTSGGSTSYDEAHANINSSTIKTYLENWYEENIDDTGYSNAIADEIFCNDRAVSSGYSGYGHNYAEIQRDFDASTRSKNKEPSFICTQKNDRFTKDDEEYGNGKLSSPVGLITSDEIMAGGENGSTSSRYSYLYRGNEFWSMSPTGIGRYGKVYVYYGSMINNEPTIETNSVVPVINLKTEYIQQFSGDGTKLNPFTVNS